MFFVGSLQALGQFGQTLINRYLGSDGKKRVGKRVEKESPKFHETLESFLSNANYNTRCEAVSAIYLSRTRYSQRHQISEPMGAIHLRSRGEQPWTVLRAEYEVYCLRHISESHLNLLRRQVQLSQLSCKFIHRLKLDTLHAKAHLGAEPPTSVILTWSSIQ